MRIHRPLKILMLALGFALVAPISSEATVATDHSNSTTLASGLFLFGLAAGDIVVVGKNLSPEVPPSAIRHWVGVGLGLASIGVALQMDDTGPALGFAMGGSLALVSSLGRMFRGQAVETAPSQGASDARALSGLSVGVSKSGAFLRFSF